MRTLAVWLSLAMIFTLPWEDSISVGGLGTVTKLIGLLMAGVWLLAVLIDGRLRKWHPFHVALWLFVLWNVLSALWSLDSQETRARILTFAQLFGSVLILWDLYVTPEFLRAGLQAYVLGGWVSIASTIINYRAGREIALYSGGRYSATGMSPGNLVLIFALSLPVAWHLASSAGDSHKERILCWANYAYVPAALFAIALSATRMALFAVVPAILYILGTTARLKLGARIVVLVVLLSGISALPAVIPQSAIDRLATTGDSIESADLGGRVDLWRAAFTQFSQHPLLGIGSGAFRAVAEAQTVVHNTYLSVLTEGGIVGFALFMSVLALAIYGALHQPAAYSRLWLALLLIWAIGVSVQTWEHVKSTWLLLGLVVVSANVHHAGSEGDIRANAAPVSEANPDRLGVSHAQ